MNRAQRRAAAARLRAAPPHDDLIIAFDRADLVRIVAAMVEVDDTVSGATIVTADGKTTYLSADALRRGGHA